MAMHIMGKGLASAGKGGATDWAGPGCRRLQAGSCWGEWRELC